MTTPSKAGADAILTAAITELETGNWTMDLSVATEDELSGVVPLLISGSLFLGAVVRGAVDGGKWSGRICGGKGGMQTELPSRAYTGATVGMILAAIAVDAKEVISGEILPTVLATALPSWSRPVGKTSRAVADLADNLGLNWRVTRSGEIWIGEETYQPVVGLDFTQLSQGANDSVTIAPQDPLVSPGDLFETRKVSDVITTLTGESLEQKVAFKTDDKAGIAAIIARLFDRMIGRRIDLSASYPATVILQGADGNLDVKIDHPRLAGEGMKGVPIRLGIPGAKCTVKAGARVRIYFDEQDQSKPYAALWDFKTVDVTVIEIGVTPKFATRDDLLQTFMASVKTWMDGHVHGVPAGTDAAGGITGVPGTAPIGVPPAPSPPVAPTACATLKVN